MRENETLTPMMAFERGLVETYVEQRLLARAALDRGLQRAPTVLRRVNAARDRVLAATYLEREIGEAVTPETVKRFFDANADVTKLGEEVRARHILVETEAEAAAILAQLRGGADFDAVAREQSLDRATAPLGGAVGWFSRPMMTPAFSRAAFATATGEFSDPFLTEFGWHVVEVLGRRSSDQVPFDEVEASISEFLRLRTIETTLKSLVEDNQVVYFRPDPSLNARARAATGVMDASLTDAELR
ncbi:MAG: peptidylprolyl isomerase [Pseudomonadota bacterium]